MFIFATLRRVNYFFTFYFMSRLSIIASMLVVATTFVSTMSAATSTGNTATGEATPINTSPIVVPQPKNLPLLLDSIKVENTQTFTLKFNQSVYANSIRVRVIDQGTNENMQIASITGTLNKSGALDPSMVTVTIESAFIPKASYILTITAALSLSDTTIKAGIDSIREFAAPSSIKAPGLNAAPNPTAVIATGTVVVTPAVVGTGKITTGSGVAGSSELPETGVPTIIMIILAAVSAMGLLFFRKRA